MEFDFKVCSNNICDCFFFVKLGSSDIDNIMMQQRAPQQLNHCSMYTSSTHLKLSVICQAFLLFVVAILTQDCNAATYFLHTPKSGGASAIAQMLKDADVQLKC